MGLREKILDRSAKVGVLGLGYVGLPLAVEFAKAGFRVFGIDVDADRVSRILAGDSYIQDVPSRELAPLVRDERFLPTTDFSVLRRAAAVSICVPTPLSKTRDQILDAAASVMHTLGLARTTTREIAQAAGLSEAALYRHFEDKAELFLSIYDYIARNASLFSRKRLLDREDTHFSVEPALLRAVHHLFTSLPHPASVPPKAVLSLARAFKRISQAM